VGGIESEPTARYYLNLGYDGQITSVAT
jgi:hypothetical protein